MEKNEKKSAVKDVAFPKAGGSGLENYINNVYEASEQARLAGLEQMYNDSIARHKAAAEKSNAAYLEGKRQADAQAARQNAGFRELANARGLNSGAVGQAAVMQNNQLQSDLTSLGRAQAASNADLDMQRNLLKQNFDLQRQQAVAENQAQRANAMYNEKVRMDEIRRQQAQFDANMQMQYAKMAAQAAAQRQKEAAKAKGTTNEQRQTDEKLWDDSTAYDKAIGALAEIPGSYKPMTYAQWQSGSYSSDFDSYSDYVEAFVDEQARRAREEGVI